MIDIIISILAMTSGFVLIFFALWELLLRVCIALVGLWLINYGSSLRGKGSLYTRAYNWYWYRKF